MNMGRTTNPGTSLPTNLLGLFLYTPVCEATMRRDYLFFLTALLISSATFGQNPSTPRPKAEKCAVAGMVVRKGSNEPIHFARVTLSREGEEQKLLHAATGADGRFVIKDVIPGEYQLTVSHNG